MTQRPMVNSIQVRPSLLMQTLVKTMVSLNVLNTFIVNIDGNDDDSETAGVRVSSQEVSDVSAHFQQLSF